ncbi:MAG: polysaccharide biosynthesis protein [Bacteroidales bacterium]|nr:polysaccharide biosynthesis protein [Bacteroidales bacterium]
MSFLKRQLERFRSSYLSVWVVLAIDVVISMACTFFVLGAANMMAESTIYAWEWFAFDWLLTALLSSLLAFLVLRTHYVIVRHTTLRDLVKFLLVAIFKGFSLALVVRLIGKSTQASDMMAFLDALVTLIALVGYRVLVIRIYDLYKSRVRAIQSRKRLLVYGTGDKAVSIIIRLRNSPHFEVVGFISGTLSGGHRQLMDRQVYHFTTLEQFRAEVTRLSLSAVLFVKPEDIAAENEHLVRFCTASGVKVLVAPQISDSSDQQALTFRKLRIEDLLGREEISISMEEISASFSGKSVMVTGAAGSIGSEICRQLAALDVGKLILYDDAETPTHDLRLELEARFPKLDFAPVIGDVRSERRLDYVFNKYQPQVVFHAAAYKHVPLMEENPCEAVLANLGGSRLVADKCIAYGVEKMVMISTDKAVNPTNVMGTTKRLAEMYVQSLGLAREAGRVQGSTHFVTTRFGNVLGSNGSVIPRFRQQIAEGGPLTVTHPDITRYFMTIPEACRLVMEAAVLPFDNRIFVFDMGAPVKIADLAARMIELSGRIPDVDIKIKFTGLRPGEKLYEEVLSSTENTDPTPHERIRIARVRPVDYEDISVSVDEILDAARRYDIDAMVRLMKRTVPEWKSNNSVFEKYD